MRRRPSANVFSLSRGRMVCCSASQRQRAAHLVRLTCAPRSYCRTARLSNASTNHWSARAPSNVRSCWPKPFCGVSQRHHALRHRRGRSVHGQMRPPSLYREANINQTALLHVDDGEPLRGRHAEHCPSQASGRRSQRIRPRAVSARSPARTPGKTLASAYPCPYYSDKRPDDAQGQPSGEPVKTITTKNRHALVTASSTGMRTRATSAPWQSRSCYAPFAPKLRAVISAKCRPHWWAWVGTPVSSDRLVQTSRQQRSWRRATLMWPPRF